MIIIYLIILGFGTKFMKTKPCVLQPLASSAFCELWRCSDCGTVHFRLDNVTFRLSWDRAVGVANTFNMAMYHSETSPDCDHRDVLTKRIVN